jgi:hypothetical protein
MPSAKGGWRALSLVAVELHSTADVLHASQTYQDNDTHTRRDPVFAKRRRYRLRFGSSLDLTRLPGPLASSALKTPLRVLIAQTEHHPQIAAVRAQKVAQ